MKYHTLQSTGFVLYHKKTFNWGSVNNLLMRCLDQLWKDIIPTIIMLICSSIITLYVCELIDRTRMHSMELKPAHTRYTQPYKS
ncbi:MAG: hypothetical protein C0615_06075 [Desulfuromonas sp.]|nr:MAG: hypothetical protein C0615_06075 [Desulfuromonas sp.]